MGSLLSFALRLGSVTVALVFLIVVGRVTWNLVDKIGVIDTPPVIGSTGPTVKQLENLRSLVSTRVHITDVLRGETSYLKGIWIVAGDALIGVDLSKAVIRDKDDVKHRAMLVLPNPQVVEARVDHDLTQQVELTSNTRIPFVAYFLGKQKELVNQAMSQAQQLIERSAAVPEFKEAARRDTERILTEFYSHVDWTITVEWEQPSETASDGEPGIARKSAEAGG